MVDILHTRMISTLPVNFYHSAQYPPDGCKKQKISEESRGFMDGCQNFVGSIGTMVFIPLIGARIQRMEHYFKCTSPAVCINS
jgi:hypothetical protein